MNLSTLLGVLAGFVMLSWAVLSQTGLYKVFVNPPGMAIVLGGVICSILVAYPIQEVLRVFRVLFVLMRKKAPDFPGVVRLIARLSGISRKEGFLALERELAGIEDKFLVDGLQMVISGYSEEEIREIMQSRIENRRIRELAEAHIFHTMARFAPAFGMVGTLVGLIGMLVNMGKGNLADMGQNMAVALVTTFYGLILANLVFRPIAVQIERRMEESLRLMTMVMEGVLMIHQKWHPYKVEDYLNSFLPPGRREVAVRRYQEREELK